MSSLFIINKAIDRASGTGLPFYTVPNYVFSVSNNQFNGTDGLWKVPTNRVPTFQIHIENNLPTDFVTFEVKYVETKGGNNLTGYTYIIPNTHVTMVKRASKNGQTINIFQSDDGQKIASPPRCGRWILQLTIENNGAFQIYYSEEFVTYE